MKLATIRSDGAPVAALVAPEKRLCWPVRDLVRGGPDGLLDVAAAWDELKDRLAPRGPGRHYADADLMAPIPRPPHNVYCVGKNYVEHAREFHGSGFDASAAGMEIPDVPIIFTKASNSIAGPFDDVTWDEAVAREVDYEAELAVVIGRRARKVSRDRALAHVWGYTLVNDVTARDRQKRFKQWFMGKSLDGFCPMGPWVTTADEVDLDRLSISCWVNDELRQQAPLTDLIFDVPAIIAEISAGITLEVGDVIATGTPPGVGIGFKPPRFLKNGDVVRIRADGLGELKNTFRPIKDAL